MRGLHLSQCKRRLQLSLLLAGGIIITAAPLVGAVAQDDLEEFAKWPFYAPCDTNIGASGQTAGVTVTGTSPFLSGDPLTLTYPSISDEPAFAKAIEDFVRSSKSNSPWLDIPDLGTKLVNEGKIRGVNPMLIVVIGRHETQLGADGGASAQNNNSFGNKGNGPNGYLAWPSFEASLIGDTSFTKAVEDRLEGKHLSYAKVTNMYEYLSVHISGKIIYPGEATVVRDGLMDVDITVTNVVGYFEHAKTWIGEMTGLTITGIPSPRLAGPTDDFLCEGQTTQGNTGIVNPEGYSFPIEPQTKRNYGGLPCPDNSTSCRHHDGTPALDLLWGSRAEMSGKKVFAISDGTIKNRNVYRGVQGCYSIQFHSTKDGTYYWYGHLQKPNEKLPVGTVNAVKAGDLLAEVARTELGPVCHGRAPDAPPGPHLHIDRGCKRDGAYQPGGKKSCRDPAFIPFMKAMWAQLPEPGSTGGNAGGDRPE